ncbi:MAG: DUF308 domain-containing protein [Coriobacteriales bacterium]|jgi:uncharacterized membrane protein HdeD (DUF308 family)|nr:DUF308 domain-containing protein [Coriobacteriales bacterium]
MSNDTNNTGTAIESDILITRFFGGHRAFGAIIGIIMIVIGILFIAKPLEAVLALDLLVTLGFLLYGVYQIVSYVRTPALRRSGWQLAFGIIWVLMAMLVVASGASGLVITFAFVLGFLALLGGCMQVSLYVAIRGEAGAGLLLVSAIINIILGIILLTLPFFAVAVLALAQGIYLVIAGLALILEALSGYGHRVI